MNIPISGQKAHSTKTFINVLLYLNEVIARHGLCGNFNFANLEDLSIAYEYGLTKVNKDGILCMSNIYYAKTTRPATC